MRATWFATVLVLLCCEVAYAQDAEVLRQLRYYRDQTQVVLRNAAVRIQPVLTSSERAILQDTLVTVPATGDVTALARRRNGNRNIIISAGFTEVLEWATTSIVLDQSGFKGCYMDYMSHLLNGIAYNSQAVAAGGAPMKVYAPIPFGTVSGNRCSGATMSAFNGDPGRSFAGFMSASIFFLYLHELAHHMLGHVDSGTGDKAAMRQQEAAADGWAMKTAHKAAYDLSLAIPVFSIIAGLGGVTIEDERKSTHPLGVRRVYELLDAAREWLVTSDPAAAAENERIATALKKLIPEGP